MKTEQLAERSLHLLFTALLIAAMLTACSGGGVDVSVQGPVITPSFPPAQTNEAIRAHGTITGLGGVTINNVRYLTNSAMVTYNGNPGALSDLRHGQVVTVHGRIDGGGGVGIANNIYFDANVIGPVDSIDAGNRQLIVMGQTVSVDPDTLFGGGIDVATFAGLPIGGLVEVSGYADAAGAIRATRIDRAPAGAEYQLIGQLEDLDLANLLFAVNRLTLDYSAAVLIDLPGGAPANGMAIKVIGTMSGGLFRVERLAAAPSLAGMSGIRVQTAGLITRFNSPADFDVNGYAAASNAGTLFFNGNSGDLGLNAELIIDGNLASNGRITANRITIGRVVDSTVTLAFDYRDFTEINVPTVFNVTVTQGPEFSVEVVIDEEASNRVNITQTGAVLNIALEQANGNLTTYAAFVTMPVLDKVDVTGVANVTLNGFNQSQMDLRLASVSHLTGNALTIDNLTADVSGVSRLDLGDIRPIGYADIRVSGVSQATLNMGVGSTMTGSVATGQGTGTSSLFYYGTNVAVDVTTDSSSSIVRLGATKP